MLRFFLGLTFLLAFLALRQSSSVEQPNSCNAIDAAGDESVELNQPGNYCLLSDIQWAKSGPAILVRGEDIHVDLKGHRIHGVKTQCDQTGIVVDGSSKNITIQNGSIDFVQTGIRAQDVNNLNVSNLNISQVEWIGVHVTGDKNAVTQSRFDGIGYTCAGEEEKKYALGILANGKDMRIEHNLLRNVIRPPGVSDQTASEGVSILLSEGAEDFSIRDNILDIQAHDIAHTIGIWARSKNTTIAGNKFLNFESPILGAYVGRSELSNNKFQISSIGPHAFDRIDGQARFIAVGMYLDDSSRGKFSDNAFSGYICPIQFFGDPKLQALSIEDSTVDWPQGHRFCKDKGYWYTAEAFGPFHPSTGRRTD